jgi:hypothetical protein
MCGDDNITKYGYIFDRNGLPHTSHTSVEFWHHLSSRQKCPQCTDGCGLGTEIAGVGTG